MNVIFLKCRNLIDKWRDLIDITLHLAIVLGMGSFLGYLLGKSLFFISQGEWP